MKINIKYLGHQPILNFFELSEAHQILAKSNLDERAEEASYFINRHNEPQEFEFIRNDDKLGYLRAFDGILGQSYFDGYLCILDSDGQAFKLFRFTC